MDTVPMASVPAATPPPSANPPTPLPPTAAPPPPPPPPAQPNDPRRGRLIAALVAAVALLLGSFIAVAAVAGGVGPGSPRADRIGPGDGTRQFWRDGDRGPGMMGDDDRTERPRPRLDRRDHMRGWENS